MIIKLRGDIINWKIGQKSTKRINYNNFSKKE